MNSILADVKEFCQVPEWDDGFDNILLVHINATLLTLSQIGIGPPGGLIVSDKDEPWTSLVEGSFEYEAVKSLVCLKVKMVFDPPSSATVAEAYNASIAELEWRLGEQAEGVFY